MQRLGFILVLALLHGCGGGGSSSRGTSAAGPASQPNTGETANAAPEASFVISVDDAEPLKALFDASASQDTDGRITEFEWDFGDGSRGNGTAGSHVYTHSGTWEVRLTVTDDSGSVDTATRNVQVTAPEDEPVSGARVSGSIRVQTSSVADSDTSDPDAPRVPNNEFASAQQVPNPATIGGHVGSGGQASGDEDRTDLYRFSALGGERVVLRIADPAQDLDLRLYDPDGRQIEASLGIDATEALEPIATAGDYYVAVTTFGNASSNYRLGIGSGPDISSLSSELRTSAEFVPGEILVGPDIVGAATGENANLPRLQRLGRAGDGQLTRLSDRYRMVADALRGAEPMDARIKARARTLEAVKRLRASGRYQWVEPNWIRRPLVTPDDEYFESQWNLHALHMPQAWDLSRGDEDVIVAVLDTGILPHHPDLGASRLVAGHDFVSDPERAGDGDGRDPDPADPGSGDQRMTSSFHGTHVAGIIAARTDNGTGVAGSGWNARVMPLRVLGRDGGTAADLIEALRYAGGLPNATGRVPERPADVINLSLGSASYSQAEQDVIAELRGRGIVVIAAAGNDASDRASYPAAYDGVVSVSATTISDDIAYYSNHGATVDIAAPGGDTSTDINGDGIADGILSTLGDDSDGDPSTAPVPNLGVMSGTSMAAPHVAGVAALMKTVYPDMTPETFDALLAGGQLTSDRGEPGRDDRYGHGLLDAQRAVLAALDAAGRSGEVPGVLVATPTALNFGPFTDRLEFRLSNAGNLPLAAGEPIVDAPWLRLEPVSADADGLGTWALIVDRDQLPEDGVYRGGVRVASDANRISLSAHVERASIDLSADVGHVHVLLTPVDDDEALYRTTARVRAGAYDFDLEGVAPGRYRLIAGTDADGDGLVCDAGEACGAWRTIDAPVILEVDEADRDGLAFVIAFRMSISTKDPVTSRP